MIRLSFNNNWFVTKVGNKAETQVGPVTVPYDAMHQEPRDPHTKNGGNTGYFPGGVYSYKKTFETPTNWVGKRVFLEFEGVYQNSKIYLNGNLIGGRPSGYALFHVELTQNLVSKGQNTLEVIADNSEEPNSRWYTGSGIYRPVWALVGQEIRVAPNGLRLSTASAEGDRANVQVDVSLTNDSSVDATINLTVLLEAPDGSLTGPIQSTQKVAAGSTVRVSQLVVVEGAMLWSPDSPNLYTATAAVSLGEEVLDTAQDDFGIRTISADSKNGLLINGKSVKLRGAGVHHDNGVIGAHTLDAAEERRVRLLKESGYNAIRSAHNPASRALLRACDLHGMLVMDELTDAWTRPKVAFDYSQYFTDWWERDLEAMISNAFNHPSVIMYSIGNEISETATPKGIATNRAIASKAKSLDSTRLITNSINGFLNLIAPTDEEKLAAKALEAKEKGENPNKNLIGILNLLLGILDKIMGPLMRMKAVDEKTKDAFADVDVAGYNYMVGRYEMDGKLHPDRVIVGSETRASLSIPAWKAAEKLPHVIGDFTWTGWDYIGEAGLATKQYGTTKRRIYHPYPALLAGEPVLDITGFRQTQSYLNEIGWHLSRGPHIAVEPVNHAGEKVVKTGWRATNSISSWSWDGCEGRVATVEVYADCDRIVLRLNGKKVGSAKCGRDGDYLTKFKVRYQPGELTAVAYEKDGTEIGSSTLVSASTSLEIDIQPETYAIRADGSDLCYVAIQLTDENGILRPLADRALSVQVSGAATLLGFGSAEAITTEAFASTTHKTFNGRAMAVLRAGLAEGPATISVSADDCATESVDIFVSRTA